MRRLLAGALLIGGCISYVPAHVDVQSSASAVAARRLDSPALRAYAERSLGRAFPQWPPSAWDLDTLTAAAFFFNDAIAVARADAAVMNAAIATAHERPNPTASANVERKAQPGVSPWVALFGLDIPIEPPAVRRGRVAAAEAAAAAQQARVATAAWNARSALRTRLLDLFAARERRSLLGREETLARDIVEVFSKRLELGEGAQPDLSRARIALAQTEMLVRDQTRAAAQAHAGIAAAAGVSDQALAGAAFDFREFERRPQIDGGARDAALTGRSDVVAALREYAAADAALRLAVARQYPDIHLAPGLGWDQGARVWSVGISAEVPLLNHHAGAIGEASARRDAAAARLVAVQASVISEWDQARAAFDAAQEKVSAADSLLHDEDEQLAAVRRQFDAGETDRLALRTAELERESAALAAADARIELQRAAGAVEDAIERPLGAAMPAAPPPMEESR